MLCAAAVCVTCLFCGLTVILCVFMETHTDTFSPNMKTVSYFCNGLNAARENIAPLILVFCRCVKYTRPEEARRTNAKLSEKELIQTFRNTHSHNGPYFIDNPLKDVSVALDCEKKLCRQYYCLI